MANPEHLGILKKGVETWNQWRRDNPEVIPDLSGANLYRTDLSGADLREANLREANLREANLNGGIVSKANLNGAILSNANLKEANFVETDLSEANLSGADLSQAVLIVAYLFATDLSQVNLSKADLYGADLSKAHCYKANLSEASLRAARLLYTNLGGATLTGACLWETQRAGWLIKGVICEYVYWDQNGEETSVFSPGEFEKLFADKTKVRLFYKDGINPLEIVSLPALIKNLEASHPVSSLRLVNIHEESGGVVVELAIDDDNQSLEQLRQLKEAIETEARQKTDYLREALRRQKASLQLQGEVERLTSHVDKLIVRGSSQENYLKLKTANEQLKLEVEELAKRESVIREEYLQTKGAYEAVSLVVDKLIARGSTIVQGDNNMGDKYNIEQGGAVGRFAHAHDMTFNQIVSHFGKSIDLHALAKQLADLREEMAKRQDSSPQAVIVQGEAAKAEIAAKEGNAFKVVEYLKAGGQGLLDIAKETGKELLIAAIKASMGVQ